MKAIRKFDNKIVEVDYASKGRFEDVNAHMIYKPSDLDFNLPSEQESAVIEGWVAVDEMFDTAYLHTKKPAIASRPFADTGEYYSEWKSDGSTYLLDKGLFPDMDYESEPLKVKIQITPME